eukprot:1175343-Prorocentrum_minimum.AAC.1
MAGTLGMVPRSARSFKMSPKMLRCAPAYHGGHAGHGAALRPLPKDAQRRPRHRRVRRVRQRQQLRSPSQSVSQSVSQSAACASVTNCALLTQSVSQSVS